MLRVLVLLLALANLGFHAWTEGWLAQPFGLRADADREPDRLQQQVQPESIQLLPPQRPGSQPWAATGG